jgi:NADH-ubiquinone oxidoreductase chain 5
MKLLTFVSIFTSFYAGLNTVFEIDLKKLIALSTLSHLGFIAIAFSAGLLHLSFFHLLVHALFKSVLFIAIGDIIININHRQDIRYLSKGYTFTPFSSTVIRISIVNLLGIPNIRGYFSKDLVLETINFNERSIFVVFIIYFNVLLTYYYTYKLLFFRFQSLKLNPFQTFHSPFLIHTVLVSVLSLFTLFFSTIYIRILYCYNIF